LHKHIKQVLLLKNIVTREELQNDDEFIDIQEDVKEECSGHGMVERVIIPRSREGYRSSAEGNVYVAFADILSAQRASAALSGRKFGDRIVTVDFVSLFCPFLLLFFVVAYLPLFVLV
jgi:splicing factor U2AF subunit